MWPRSHTRSRLSSAWLALAFIAVGCSEPIDLTVHALNAGAGVVAGARLEILKQGYARDFDADGTIRVAPFRLSGRHVFKVIAPGHETAYRVYDFKPGHPYDVTLQLRPLPAAHRVTLPPPGERVTVTEGIANVQLRGGGLVRPDGSEVHGDVDVLIVPYDPYLREPPPASLLTDTGKPLLSLGMATITITQDGQDLQPKPGMPIEWQMQINRNLMQFDRLEHYKMYYVDEATGLWHEEPAATLRHDDASEDGADRWTAELPHLSLWNADVAWAPGACVQGGVRDAHNEVYYGAATVTINDASGGGNGANVPTNQGTIHVGGTVGYSASAQLNPYFYLQVPALSGWLRDYTLSYFGFSVLPVTVRIDGSLPAGQGLASPQVQGPFSPAEGGACTEVMWQLCWQNNQACSPGDVCCDGKGCGASGLCGVAAPPPDMATAPSVDMATAPSVDMATARPDLATPQCSPSGQSCANVSACCEGNRWCLNGVCRACLPANAAGCGTTADCCGGTCINGTCIACNDVGGACSGNGQCCFGNLCVAPDTSQAPSGQDGTCRACIPEGHRTCTRQADCCNGALCDNGTCRACLGTGGSCSSSTECCAGTCINDSCQTCVPAGQSCGLGSCCPGLSCYAPNNTCQACNPKGALCTTGSDCCSGTCQDKTCN